MATREDFARVFSRLNIDSSCVLYSGHIMPCDNKWPNAEASGRNRMVRVTCPMVELCSNDDEIAGLLGHELGHIHMAHYLDYGSKDYHTIEAEANIYSHLFMKEFGYDLNRAFELDIKLRGYPGIEEVLSPFNLTIEEVKHNLLYGRSLRDENIAKNVITKCNFGQRLTSNEMRESTYK